MPSDDVVHEPAIGHRALDHLHGFPVVLQVRRITAAEVVKDGARVTPGDECIDEVRADEPTTTRHNDSHGGRVPNEVAGPARRAHLHVIGSGPTSATFGTVDGAQRDLSFVVPFWNECEGVERTIATLCAAAAQLTAEGTVGGAEVVAVDDGSTDGTSDLLDELAGRFAPVRVVHLGANQGLGAALRAGFAAATGHWIFYTDADLPVDPLVCGRALRAADLHDADIVACYRFDRTGEGLRREVLSAGYNSAVRLVTRLHVRDVNFAAKLVRRSAVIDQLPVSDSLFFDAELLARALRAGATMQQIGVDYFPRSAGTSTLSSLTSIAATARDLARLGRAVRLDRSHGPR